MNTNPLLELVKQDNDYLHILPYHIGLEIECSTDDVYLYSYLKHLKCVENNSGTYEIRIMLDTGINGLCQLYCLCLFLNLYSQPTASGIHYNIDTNINNIKVDATNTKQTNIILRELTKWDYQGKYNAKGVGTKREWCAIRVNRLEIRIGEMSFDYSFILNRISSCNSILDSLIALENKERVVNCNYEFDDIDIYLNFINIIKSDLEKPIDDSPKAFTNKTINYYS